MMYDKEFDLDHCLDTIKLIGQFERFVLEGISEDYPIEYSVSYVADKLREQFESSLRLIRDMAMDNLASEAEE